MNNEKLTEIIERLTDISYELEEIRDNFSYEKYKNIRTDLNRAVSSIRCATREIDDVKQIEGQMSLFDYEEELEV